MGVIVATVSSFSKGNITYIDDALLKTSIFALCCALAVLIAYFKAGTSAAGLLLVWAIGIAGVSLSLLLAGLYTRKREKKCVGLWRLLQTHPEIELSLYLQQSGNSLSDVQRAAQAINKAGAGLLVVDQKNDRLYDSRLSDNESIAFQCTNCGATSNASVGAIDGDPVVCQYCQAPAHPDAIPSVAGKHEALIKSNLERMNLMSRTETGYYKEECDDINIRLFLLLLMVFWPAALGYVLWKKRLLLPNPERLRSVLGLQQ